jgi:enediyne biosynthesis protein E4
MKRRILSIVLCTVFAVLIAMPVVIKHFSKRNESIGATTYSETVTTRYGFHFQEVAKAAGMNFTHQAPTFDPQLHHVMAMVASMGAAASIVDFDRDGLLDIYVTNSGEGSHNRLYRNLGNGTFRDVAAEMGVAEVNQGSTGVSMGAVWGDYDNDGYEDLFLYKWGRPELFHNDQGHKFARVTEHAGLPTWINANTAIWLDYDRDGRLDLFIGGYYAEDVNLWKLKTTRMMPESFEYAQNGGRKYMLRNRGDGTFEDVTEKLGITSRRWALAATAADLRGTGYPDLFIANDYGVSELYFNDGGVRFREVGKQTGVGFAPKSGMNAAVGDIFNQGQFAIYVTNISEKGILLQGNNLWV